jgi:hypothetical protein
MIRAIYDSAMKDKLGEGLQVKSQDELIDKNFSFRSRLRPCHASTKQVNVASTSDDKQFFEATDDVLIHSKSHDEYVKNVNQLNEDFSERISQLNNLAEGSVGESVEVVEVTEELNKNKKRVLLVQKGRDDNDSE